MGVDGRTARRRGPALPALMLAALTLALALLAPAAALAAGGDILWTVPFRGADDESANAIPAGPGGSAFLCGAVAPAGTQQVVVIKESAAGVPAWSFTWGGALVGGAELETAVYDARLRCLYLVATVDDPVHGSAFTVLRVGPNGELAWTRSYTCPSTAEPMVSAAAVDAHGGLYVAGSTLPGASGARAAFLVKFAAGGALVWERTWAGGTAEVGIAGLAVTPAGQSYVGDVERAAAGPYKGFVRKFSAQGRTLWSKRFGGNRGDAGCEAVALGPRGSIVAVGKRTLGADASADGVVEKLDSTGHRQWRRVVPTGTDGDGFSTVAVDGGGRVYAGGATAFTDRAQYGPLLVALRRTGTVRWSSQWIREGWTTRIVVVGSRVYAAGRVLPTVAGGTDIVGVRCLTTAGREIWRRAYDPGGNVQSGGEVEMSVVRDQSVYIATSVFDSVTRRDALFLRLQP